MIWSFLFLNLIVKYTYNSRANTRHVPKKKEKISLNWFSKSFKGRKDRVTISYYLSMVPEIPSRPLALLFKYLTAFQKSVLLALGKLRQ